MNDKRMQELSSLIISMDEVIGRLNSFFTDSVILKMDYSIQALGSEVESFTEFTSGELSGQAFSKICLDPNLRMAIEAELKYGYFSDMTTSFLNRDNKPVHVCISGFYLGLISDINGYIILKIKLLEDNATLKKELVIKKRELDSFIYRTAHDLRGPLATIKGLVNLLKIRQSDNEVDELTYLIEVHANKLDDRLFKLLYMADENNDADHCLGAIHFASLKNALEKTLRDNFQIDNTVFEFTVEEQTLICINEIRVTQLLSNILLYIIGLPTATIGKDEKIVIAYDFQILTSKLKVRIHAKGFVASEEIREIISQPVSLYNDILNYPFLFNYYIAQREAKKLNGTLRIEFWEEGEQNLFVSIPLNYSLITQADALALSIHQRENN